MEENQSLDSMHTEQPLPNSTAVLVLGILSIVTCWCVGIVGLILGIIALVLASKASKIYIASPSNFTSSSYGNMKAGKVCAIIGVCLSGIYAAYSIVYIIMFGAAFSALPWAEMMNQASY